MNTHADVCRSLVCPTCRVTSTTPKPQRGDPTAGLRPADVWTPRRRREVTPDPRTSPELTGWELVTAAQRGDSDAFGQLYDRYVHVVFRFVLFRVGDRSLAEDFTSETFLRALRYIDSVSYQGRDVGAWFVTIARNLILDHVKSSRYRLEQTTADMLDAGADPGPDQEVIGSATLRVLLAALATLPRLQREVLELRHVHGLSVTEVAAVVGASDAAVKARTHRGVRALAEMPELAALRG